MQKCLGNQGVCVGGAVVQWWRVGGLHDSIKRPFSVAIATLSPSKEVAPSDQLSDKDG